MHEQIIQSIRQDRDRQLVDDTLGVLVSAKYKDAALAQVAAAHMLPIEIVRAIANDLLQTATGENLEDEEFNAAINQVKWIEENIQDEGLRLWKLQALARRYRRTCTQLQEAYTKALINQKPVEPVSIREFRAQNRGRMKWLIPGWIPASTTLLIHGDGGAGKTLFTYQIFEAVVSTGIWNGYPVEVGPALLVQTDEPGLVTAERMDIQIEEVASQEERVRLWLYEDNRFGLPWSAMEVSEFLAIPQNTSRRLLRELWATGRIHRDRFNKNRYYSYYAGELRDFVNAEQTTIDCDT